MTKRTQCSMLIHSQSIQYNAWSLTKVALGHKTQARRQGIEREEAKTTRGGKGIADQCPLSGGEAVLRARALVRLLEPQVIVNYNDLALCTIVDPRERKQDLPFEGTQIALYPNPISSNQFNLTYKLPEGQNDYHLKLFNIYGAVVSDWELEGREGNRSLEVNGLSNGIYWYVVQAANKRFAQGKVVILR